MTPAAGAPEISKGRVAPEAWVGGPIAFLKNGDRVTIDAEKKVVSAELSEAEWAERKAARKKPEIRAKGSAGRSTPGWRGRRRRGRSRRRRECRRGALANSIRAEARRNAGLATSSSCMLLLRLRLELLQYPLAEPLLDLEPIPKPLSPSR